VQNLMITARARLLIEFSNAETAKWLRTPEIMEQFLKTFDEHAKFKPRTFPIILKFIPIPFDIELMENLREVERQNGCKPGDFVEAKWIKAPARRRLTQKHAHAKLFCSSAEVANKLITSTVRINNKVIGAKRDTWEPSTCSKCQRYGHYVSNCAAAHPTCRNCGKDHRTSECTDDTTMKCTPCGSTEHITNSAECPEYIKRLKVTQEKAPENLRALYPTEENWMYQDGD
ncbi:hypothetical protein CPB86DRAFT_660385, partial [Serendipita vermifera]